MDQKEKLFSENEIISAKKVMEEWGEINPDFGERLITYKFSVIFCNKPPRKSPSGEVFYIGWIGTGNNIYTDNEWFNFDGVYLYKTEVDGHLNDHQYLKFHVIEENDNSQSDSTNIEEPFSSLISYIDLEKRICLSPSQFVEVVQGNNIPAYCKSKTWCGPVEISQYDNLRFSVSDLSNAWFHENDLSSLNLSATTTHNKRIDFGIVLREDLEDELVAAREKNEYLESQVEKLNTRIATLGAIQIPSESTDQNDKPRTASACEAAQASRVEEWKRYAVVMAKIAYDCGLEDRKQVTRSEYMTLAKRYGELSKQALELLRNALPEGVTNTTGGASKQG